MFKGTEFVSVHRVCKSNVAARKKGRLHRRVYNVQGPNHLWHTDTNHKFVRWYFIIVGVVHGFSRLPISLECCTNNKAETVLACFSKGIKHMVFLAEFGLIEEEKMFL